MKKIMIAAPKSGSGKTGITIALLKALKEKGIRTVSFKSGPDYIDPLFHKSVLGIPSYNLDTYFTDDRTTKELFEKNSSGYDFAVIEGVMGLFDGVGGISLEGSSYKLASVTDTPIILVVDAKGMGAISIAALIKGFLCFDENKLIKGVILNRVSKAFFDRIKEKIEEETGIKILGSVPERKDINISSRHLGLVTPNDVENIESIKDILYEEFEKNISLNDIFELAESDNKKDTGNIYSDNGSENTIHASAINDNTESGIQIHGSDINSERLGEGIPDSGINQKKSVNDPANCVIAIAGDDAFCFLYEENIDLLKENGADIVFFSPLKDSSVPENADAIILPGGYPEEHLKELSENKSMMCSIKEAYAKGMPIVAECGGFMYLHKSIEDKEKNEYETVGMIDAKCFYTGRSQRFGYIEVKEKESNFMPEGETIKGHEFHYYESTDNGKSCVANKPNSAVSYDCIHVEDNLWAGFAHLYYPSNISFAKSIVNKAYKYHNDPGKKHYSNLSTKTLQ